MLLEEYLITRYILNHVMKISKISEEEYNNRCKYFNQLDKEEQITIFKETCQQISRLFVLKGLDNLAMKFIIDYICEISPFMQNKDKECSLKNGKSTIQ